MNSVSVEDPSNLKQAQFVVGVNGMALGDAACSEVRWRVPWRVPWRVGVRVKGLFSYSLIS